MEWNSVINDLANQGYSVQKNVLKEEILCEFRTRIAQLYSENCLRQAATAHGTNDSIRGDFILWLETDIQGFFQSYLDILGNLKNEINQSLFLGIRDIETHITVYPKTKHYDKHVDNFKGKNARKLSCILYLNESWQTTDGGELVIYSPTNEILTTVQPEQGTFVIFRSEEFPHEVKTCARQRISITSWLRN